MKTEKELKEEIERIGAIKGSMSNECWATSQLRINNIVAVTKLKTLQERNAEVKQVIDEHFGEECGFDYDKKELLQKLGLENKNAI